MKRPKYISPSSFNLFQWDKEAWAAKYLTDLPREPQTRAMAYGSAFDAAVKSEIHQRFYTFQRDWSYVAIFNKQVAEDHRDLHDAGRWLWIQYFESGAYEALIDEIPEKPRLEFTVEAEIDGVPILGKPDLSFQDKLGRHCIYDFKVRGMCSDRLTSPLKGYDWCWSRETKEVTQHKSQFTLDQVNHSYAVQLCMYAWCLGVPVGDESAWVGIEELCGPMDRLRIAKHRSILRRDFQLKLRDDLLWMWDDIVNGNVMDPGELELLVESYDTD